MRRANNLDFCHIKLTPRGFKNVPNQQKLYNLLTYYCNIMALRTKKMSEASGMQVFTDAGEFFGEIEEAILIKNKIEGWKVKATRGSFLTKALGGAKGVVVPHQLVKSMGSICIVSKAAAPSYAED